MERVGKIIARTMGGADEADDQAAEGDPLDDLDTLTRIATSVLRGGAGGDPMTGITPVQNKTPLDDVRVRAEGCQQLLQDDVGHVLVGKLLASGAASLVSGKLTR